MKKRKVLKCDWNETPGCDINAAHTTNECYKPLTKSKATVSVSEHTPTPWKPVKDGALDRMIVDSKGSTIAHVLSETTINKDAAFIVRAVNAHEELMAIVKAIAESFNAGASQVYAEALAPHTDDETLKTWINKAIAKASGGI